MTDMPRPAGAQIDCEAILQMVPAYCAGALDAEELAQFEATLPHCPEATAEIGQYRGVMNGLLMAVPEVAAPSAVRARLLAALEESEQPAASSQPTAVSKRQSIPIVQLPQPQNQAVASLQEVTRPRSLWLPLAVACVALLLGFNVYLLNRVSGLESALQAQDEALVTALGEGTPSRAQLVSADANSDEQGRLTWVATPDGERWVAWLVVENLPALPEGEVYRLWITRTGEQPVNLGSLRVTEAGAGAFVFIIAEPIEAYDRVFVTREQAAGSAEPSVAPLIQAEV